MFVENVAQLLNCSIDTIRRIPRSELPAVKIGARLQYDRGDVLAYVKRRKDKGTATDVRRPAAKSVAAQPVSNSYDPVADLNAKRIKK